jgi:L-arabinokinase
VEIINALAVRCPGVRVFVRSSAARWLLERTIATPFELDDRPCDTGVVQIDSLHLDPAATIAQAAAFYRTLDARAADEAALLQSRGVDFVVCDAPPLAFRAAARAGVPSVVVANFTWDWIYEEYAEHLADAPELLPAIRAAYREASAAWRLPLHGGFETFGDAAGDGGRNPPLVDVPLVARHSTHARDVTRARVGLPLDRRLVLPSFGGYGVGGLDLDAVDLPPGWDVVRGLDQAEIYDAGLGYQDLVRAVDAVITKPGYGIVSECIANGAPVVYTSRGRFAEYGVFVRNMPRLLRCAYIDTQALLTGAWAPAIESAVNAPEPPEHPRTDGARVIADMIAACSAGASFSQRPPPP